MKHIPYLLISKKFVINILLEFGPVAIFILLFYIRGPYIATSLLMIMTLISTFITFQYEKRIPLVALYVTLLTLVFGYMTLHNHNVRFLQIRDTMYDIILAITISVGLLLKKNVLKVALSSFISLSDKVWNKFAITWVFFFLGASTLNEYVRTHYSFRTWLDYKIAMIFVTLAFGAVIIYFFTSRENKGKNNV